MIVPVILDDIAFSLQSAGGVTSYWSNLTRFLEIRPECHVRRLAPSSLSAVIRYLPLLTNLQKPAIFHSSYYRWCADRNAIGVTTVYDFIYERYRRGPPLWLHHSQKRAALQRSRALICISEATKADVLRFMPESVEKALIKVIYPGVGSDFRTPGISEPRPRWLPAQDYVLFVGSRSGYKNFTLVERLIPELSRHGLQVVTIGGETKSPPEKALRLHGLSNTELNLAYNNAHALIYPSRYEGFGLPVAEAMSAGCPVLCSEGSSLREVGGDAAIYIDPDKPAMAMRAIEALKDSEFRRIIVSKGLRQARKFNWKNAVDATIELYQEAFAMNSK